MNLDARQLLRRLEHAVRPAGTGRAGSGREPIDRSGFDDLLARAASGEFASGREVDQSALQSPLSDEVRERLGHVADAAETAGYRSVLVVVDDRPLVLSVDDRRLEGELDAAEGDVLRPIDAAVRLVAGSADRTDGIVAGPSAASVPPAIAEAILAGRSIQDTNHPQDARGDAA